jgi:hypothetical protein
MIRNSLMLSMTLVMLVLLPRCKAQDEAQVPNIDSAMAVTRAGMQADKATIVGQAMRLSDKDAAAFWPIYREYEYERSRVDDGREAVIKQYTDKYPNLTDADAKAMADRMLDYDSQTVALKKRYFRKFNKVLPALTVTQFFQLEHRIDLVMDVKVESTLPPLTQAQYMGESK